MAVQGNTAMTQADSVAPSRAAYRSFEIAAQPVVKRLTGRFAWPTVLMLLGILAGLAVSATLAVSGLLSYWIAVPLNALLIYYSFTPLHEAVHRNIAGRHADLRWLELVVGHISGLILLAPYPGFERIHLHHHQHTNDPKEDPSYWIATPNPVMAVLRCMTIQPAFIWHLVRLAKDPVGKRALRDEFLYVGLIGGAIAGAFWLGFGMELLLLWILPGYIGVVMCPLLFDVPVHFPHKAQSRYIDSSILLFPRPVRAVIDCLFSGHTYHLMHHLYPRIPFYSYGTAYYALADKLPGTGAPIRRLGPGT